MAKRLTFYIMVGLILGIVTGAVLHESIADSALLTEIGKWLRLVTTVFLRLIKMIIAPLVFATLVSVIFHMGDTAARGRGGYPWRCDCVASCPGLPCSPNCWWSSCCVGRHGWFHWSRCQVSRSTVGLTLPMSCSSRRERWRVGRRR